MSRGGPTRGYSGGGLSSPASDADSGSSGSSSGGSGGGSSGGSSSTDRRRVRETVDVDVGRGGPTRGFSAGGIATPASDATATDTSSPGEDRGRIREAVDVDVSGDVPAARGDPSTEFEPVEVDSRVARPGERTTTPDSVDRADPTSGSDVTTGDAFRSVRDRDTSSFGDAAIAAGGAGVVTPEPATTAGGAALATLGAGALAIDAARRAEIDVPERDAPTREIDIPERRDRAPEVTAPTSPTVGRPELQPGSGLDSEIAVPSQPTRGTGEVDVPDATAQQLIGGQITREEDDEFVIDEDVIADREQVGELDEAERQRQIREELERRQEFVRDVPDDPSGERGGVRFPAEEAIGGTTTGLADEIAPEFDRDVTTGFGVGTATSALRDEFVGGFEDSDDAGGLPDRGVDPLSPSETLDPVTDTPADTGIGTGTPTGTGTREESVPMELIRAETALGTQQPTDVATAQTTGAEQALADGQAVEATEELAEPTLTEAVFAEPTEAAFGTGQQPPTRDPPRPPVPEAEREPDPEPFALAAEDDVFGTGILGGDEAFERLLRDR